MAAYSESGITVPSTNPDNPDTSAAATAGASVYSFKFHTDYNFEGNLQNIVGKTCDYYAGVTGTQPKFFMPGQILKVPTAPTGGAFTATSMSDYTLWKVNSVDLDTANYAIAESWNGTAWTEVGDLNTARRGAAAGKQSSTAGLVFGGFITAVTALNEAWNGSAWTEVADLNTASAFKAGAGTQASALAATGDPNATEEFTLPVETSETITTS